MAREPVNFNMLAEDLTAFVLCICRGIQIINPCETHFHPLNY